MFEGLILIKRAQLYQYIILVCFEPKKLSALNVMYGRLLVSLYDHIKIVASMLIEANFHLSSKDEQVNLNY